MYIYVCNESPIYPFLLHLLHPNSDHYLKMVFGFISLLNPTCLS